MLSPTHVSIVHVCMACVSPGFNRKAVRCVESIAAAMRCVEFIVAAVRCVEFIAEAVRCGESIAA